MRIRLTSNGTFVILLAAVMTACGDSSTGSVTQPASLTLVPSRVSFDSFDDTEQLDATVRDALGNEVTTDVTFTSSDESIATVSPSGLVTAVGVGAAEITASADSLTRSSSVVVAQVPTAVVKVSGDGQSEGVTLSLNQPLVVSVVDGRGNGIAGLGVTFSLNEPSGSLSTLTGTTSADGTASTELTLGTVAGPAYRVTARSEITAAGETVFLATGLPDLPAASSVDSGNAQRQPIGTELPNDLVARVVDQYDNGVPGHTVTFTAAAGNGSTSPASAVTDQDGFAKSRWMLGGVLGPQQAVADAGSLAGSPLSFTATGTDLTVTGIQPATLVPGQAATITGTGFDANIVNDSVIVDGVLAVVNSATTTSIGFTVPMGACRPAQSVNVVVSTALGGSTPPTAHQWAPADVVSLAVGEQAIVQDPNAFCFQFAASTADEEYLLGVQSASFISGTRTPARIKGETVGGAPAAFLAPTRSLASGPMGPVRIDEDVERWRRHREAEVELRAGQRAAYLARTLQPNASYGSAVIIDSTVQPGAAFTVKVPDIRPGRNFCQESQDITAIVQVVGQRGIWLADASNPTGYTTSDYQAFSDQFDSQTYATNVSYFGDPTDQDGNGRILILITRQINAWSQTVLGFVAPTDLVPVAECASSNEAEIFYGRAPDQTGINGTVYPVDAARGDAPPLIAHEFSHIIQQGRRQALGPNQFMSAFMSEGQATFAEEVVGHAVENNSTGQNYGFGIGFLPSPTTGVAWYNDGFSDISFFLGRNLQTPNVSVEGAPERCSWMSQFPTPCGGRSLWYGVTWSFLRWMSDHLGPSFAGGEQEFQQQLIGNTNRGLNNIQGVVGERVDSLLAQWAAAMYVDDRIPGVATRLTMPSWNYFDIYGGNNLSRSSRLEPASIAIGDFQTDTETAAGSTAYYLLSGANRPATSVRVRDLADGTLPVHMQVFLVRTR